MQSKVKQNGWDQAFVPKKQLGHGLGGNSDRLYRRRLCGSAGSGFILVDDFSGALRTYHSCMDHCAGECGRRAFCGGAHLYRLDGKHSVGHRP